MLEPALPSHTRMAGKQGECFPSSWEKAETRFKSCLINEVICLVIQVFVGFGENDISSAHSVTNFFVRLRSTSRRRFFSQYS